MHLNMRPQLSSLAITYTLFGLCAAVGSTVDLGYAIYEGVVQPSEVITQWLGMRFAAPPLGNLRFRAPQDPIVNRSSVQLANQNGPLCLGVDEGFPAAGEAEDCLFVDVFAPTHATPSSKLPVFFWIDPGGFAGLSAANLNGDDLIMSSKLDIIVVTSNYRVGLHGFLASEEVRKDGDLNAGLLDQRKALEWVHEHISKFGGDPGHVTLGGGSAGATSIAFFLTAFNAAPTNLFHAAIAESRAGIPMLNVAQSRYQYTNLTLKTGCQNAKDTLACLRGVSAAALQSVNDNFPYPNRPGSPLFTWVPVIDGDMIVENTITMFEQGRFIRVPTVFGDDTNEGTVFVPGTTNTTAQMATFFKNNFVGMTDAEADQIISMYPQSDQFTGKGTLFSALANAYGELAYICPGLLFSSSVNKVNSPTWNYRWNVLDPDQAVQGLGVPHTIEINAIWGPENTNGASPASYFTTNAPIVPIVQAYWTSFIRSFNPNTHRLPDMPVWEPFGTEQARLRLQTNATAMEVAPDDQKERCALLNPISVQIQVPPPNF